MQHAHTKISRAEYDFSAQLLNGSRVEGQVTRNSVQDIVDAVLRRRLEILRCGRFPSPWGTFQGRLNLIRLDRQTNPALLPVFLKGSSPFKKGL